MGVAIRRLTLKPNNGLLSDRGKKSRSWVRHSAAMVATVPVALPISMNLVERMQRRLARIFIERDRWSLRCRGSEGRRERGRGGEGSDGPDEAVHVGSGGLGRRGEEWWAVKRF